MTESSDDHAPDDLVPLENPESAWSRMSPLVDRDRAQSGAADQPFHASDFDPLSPDIQDEASHHYDALADPSVLPVTVYPFLRQVSDRMAKQLAHELRKLSGTLVDVAVIDLVNLRMGHALASIPIPSLIGVIAPDPPDCHILSIADGSMAALYFDLVLGGAQIRSNLAMPVRNFSVIETQLFQMLVECIARVTTSAFSALAPVAVKMDRVETNPRFLPTTKAQDSVIKIRFVVQCAVRTGFIDCYFPARFLTPIDARLRPSKTSTVPGVDPLWQAHLKNSLLASHIELKANLSDLFIPLYRLRNLKRGDVLPLDKGPDSLIDLMIDHQVLTRGRMGRSTGKIAIRVEEAIRRNSMKGMA